MTLKPCPHRVHSKPFQRRHFCCYYVQFYGSLHLIDSCPSCVHAQARRLLLAAVAVGSANALHMPSQSFAPIHRANAAPIASLSSPVLVRDNRVKSSEESTNNLRLRGGASPSSLVFSLFKAIVGSGVLSLAGGVAAFTDDSTYLPAAVRNYK
jgi:hypothetical protein